MMLRPLFALPFFLCWISPVFGQKLPVDVSTRVGRAAEFVYNYSKSEYLTKLGTWDFIWANNATGAQGGVIQFPTNTLSSGYVPGIRIGINPARYGQTVLVTACEVPTGAVRDGGYGRATRSGSFTNRIAD